MRFMTRIVLMATLSCGMALAQSSMYGVQDNHDKKVHDAGRTKTLKGCVQEKDGGYWLMTNKYSHGVELLGSDEVKNQVGHKVEATGTLLLTDKADVDIAKHASKDSEDTMGNQHESGERMENDHKHVKADRMQMNVSNIQSKSGTCDMK
jgi:hypothetical protein